MRDLINRWIVSRYEELALIDLDAVNEPEAGSTDPCPEAEPPNRLLPAPEAPETKDSGGPQRTSGAIYRITGSRA